MQKNPGSIALLSHRATVFLSVLFLPPFPSVSLHLLSSHLPDPLLVFSGQEAIYRLTTITCLTTGEHARGRCCDALVHSLIYSFCKCLFSTCSILYLALLSVLEIKGREGGGVSNKWLGQLWEKRRGIKKTVAPLRLQGCPCPKVSGGGEGGKKNSDPMTVDHV